jgi:hypothetical protein
VGPDTSKNGWLELNVDLSAFAGRTESLELVNQPTGWAFEGAHWAEISVEAQE